MSLFQISAACLSIATSSCLPGAWQQFSAILLRGGVYSSICDEYSSVPTSSDAICLEQQQKLTDIYSVYFATWCGGSALAGISVDKLGLRITVIIGNLGLVLTTFCFGYGANYPGLIILCVALQGILCNFLLYGGMMLADYHPNNSALVMALCVGAMSLNSAVLPIIYALWNRNPHWEYSTIWLVYNLCFIIPTGILFSAVSPGRRPSASGGHPGVGESVSGVQNESEAVNLMLETSDAQALGKPLDNIIASDTTSTTLSVVGKKKLYCAGQPVELKPTELRNKNDLTFWEGLVMPEYIVVVLQTCVLGLTHVYWLGTIIFYANESVSLFTGWIMISMCVVSPIWGWIANYFTSGMMTIFITLLTHVFLACSLIPNIELQYFTASIFVLADAYLSNPRFTVCQVFSPFRHLGSLMGLTGILIGGAELLNLVVSRSTRYSMCFWIFVLLCIPVYPMGYWLHRREVRQLQINALVAMEADRQANASKMDTIEI